MFYLSRDTWCLHLDSNQEPMDYESTALTNCAIEASFFGASGRNRTGMPCGEGF